MNTKETYASTNPWTPGTWELYVGGLIRSVHGDTATPLAETRMPYRRGVGSVRASEEELANGRLLALAPALARELANLVMAPGMMCQTPEEQAAKTHALELLDAAGWKWGE